MTDGDQSFADEWTVNVLRRFAEAHAHEYAGYDTLLAIIRTREALGLEPTVPEHAHSLWDELEVSNWTTDEETDEELREYMEDDDD